MKWLLEHEEYLIDLIRPQKCLWDTKHTLYMKKSHRNRLMRGICKMLSDRYPDAALLFTYENVNKKFQNLRTYFQTQLRCLNKQKNESGVEIVKPKWAHFERMLFLQDNVTPSASSSNQNNSSTSEADPSGSQNLATLYSFTVPIITDVSGNNIECSNLEVSTAEREEIAEREEVEAATNAIVIPHEHCYIEQPDTEERRKDTCDKAVATVTKYPQTLSNEKKDDPAEVAEMHFGNFIAYSLLTIKDVKKRDLCHMEIIQTLAKYKK
ncbi:uncharacterized protein LOC129221302 [Uloborus diversus]|uniref:uncharacterized protein LOC129221302 n=1 Tax=Uloborus diversus TaxID=327109 RepID=UPI0024098099|nr:uncharacterized protein LOC129221302 [Uloborus diversus]